MSAAHPKCSYRNPSSLAAQQQPRLLSRITACSTLTLKTASTRFYLHSLHGMHLAMTPNCILTAWNTHEHELRVFLLSRLDNQNEADDMLQELFLKLVRQNTAFCAVQNPKAWLFRVLRNHLIDRRRTAKTFVELDLNADLPPPSNTPTPITQLESCLLRNLAELCDQDKSVIEQCDLHGQTQQDYALQHQLTLSAVKSRLLRARKRLRDKIIMNCQVQFDEQGQVCCHIPR